MGNLKQFSDKVDVLDASDITRKETGSALTSNIFLLGYVVGKAYLPLEAECVLDAIKEIVPEKYFEMNKKIFEIGLNYK